MVEKIAVILWRQRRLINAETATIELGINPARIANEVTSALGLSGFNSETIEPKDLQPFDQEQSDQLDWCKAVIAQYNDASLLTLDGLSKAAPLIYAQLAQDAEADEETIPEYLTHFSLKEYIDELIRWCRREIEQLDKRKARQPILAALAEKAEDKHVVPWQKLELLSKYQTTLDNQLYKAMKAFRDEQAWRMSLLDTIEPAGEDVPAGAT